MLHTEIWSHHHHHHPVCLEWHEEQNKLRQTKSRRTVATSPRHILHWQASCLVKCVVSRPTAAPVLAIANLESESETKKDRAFKSSCNARYNSGSLMPAMPYNVHFYTGGGWGGDHDFEISASTLKSVHPKQLDKCLLILSRKISLITW